MNANLKKMNQLLDAAVANGTKSAQTAAVYKEIAAKLFDGTMTDTAIKSFSRLLQVKAVISFLKKFGLANESDTFGLHLDAIRSDLKGKAKAAKADRNAPKTLKEKMWTPADVADVSAALPDSDQAREIKKAMTISYLTGMREFEILKLQSSDISDNGSYLEITVKGKGRKTRTVFAPRIDMLINFKPFTISQRYLLTTLSRAIAKTGKQLTFHGLRHTFASVSLRAGTGLKEVQDMLGHADIETTQIYLHAEKECPQTLLNLWRSQGIE